MDKNEMIALGVVAAAVLLAIRYFIRQKSSGCCSKDCFKPQGPHTKK